MENYIKGKIKNVIYHNKDNGYLVGLFRIKETNDTNLLDKINKSITITGTFLELLEDIDYELIGELKHHDRYGTQFVVTRSSLIIPEKKDNVIEFLSSSFVKGCGLKTAKSIVDTLGSDALNIIKNDKLSLMNVKGMTEARMDKIYNSIILFNKSSDLILKLQELGFNIEDSGRIYNKYKEDLESIIENNLYELCEIIEFKKVDNIYLRNHEENDKVRINACILEALKLLSFNKGDTYSYYDEIIDILKNNYNIFIDYDAFLEYASNLNNLKKIFIEDDRYYLKELYDDELTIVKLLKKIDGKKIIENDYNDYLVNLEKSRNITYNDDQINAIMSSLNSNISIISGGPGTGKTTIINAIVKIYIEEHHLSNIEILEHVALLAPTGRASKRMSSSTNLPASTIHRYLKWNKDTNEFSVNEKNKNIHKLIIVDEFSMIDTSLFAALLKGINSDVKLILVGDIFQLPSVGPGNILSDLIKSDLFTYNPLNIIYRQSENSYIPLLAKEIKNKELTESFLEKKDDYNFIKCDREDIKKTIESIVIHGLDKGLNEENLQILAPMYKGENGIDNLNLTIKEIFNPGSKKSVRYGDIQYKVDDKVLQLVNDTDNYVFNGDIGFIKSIETDLKGKDKITIDFDGNYVIYEKKDLKNIRHAYAITVHKSQGSEFDHVIMPITINYGAMLYNKLIYTGVSRAKKSLILVGDPMVFSRAIQNDYGSERKTSLKEKLINSYK